MCLFVAHKKIKWFKVKNVEWMENTVWMHIHREKYQIININPDKQWKSDKKFWTSATLRNIFQIPKNLANKKPKSLSNKKLFSENVHVVEWCISHNLLTWKLAKILPQCAYYLFVFVRFFFFSIFFSLLCIQLDLFVVFI